ncbi:PNGase F N-terminal domain-containing protein [Parabacteroides bouchesdurhonensis]|uniref:PNGase F N-terminal domain-containing protein n=1 Tax=Parabacteroides bouchesdurhonensis TaxID=1936995 RepID=UPI00164DD75C|nr:PNGase F N-terminal domain-containing protein [Parabacteroides bouchesdurhonensis]
MIVKKIVLMVSVLMAYMLTSCGPKELPAMGDYSLCVFDNTPICFNPDKYPGAYDPGLDSIYHLVNGRIILKKITLPDYKRNVDVDLRVTIASNGDRWDKSGSCFVLPKASGVNLLNVARGEKQFPAVDSTKLEQMVGIIPGNDYLPTVELMRFMTPFGVGYYSNPDNSLTKHRKPVYIDHWEDSVSWVQNITDLYPLLEGGAYVGVFIDSWTAEGYIVNMTIEIKESDIINDALPNKHVEPLINTVYYVGQAYPDIFARKDVSMDFYIPENAKDVRLKYIVTGHGGHSGGDEFVQKRNIVSIDGKPVLDFIPWRTDCASFRRFNPATGVWLQKRLASYITDKGYAEKEVEEPVGSSDFSRSNWCPGTDVIPEEIELTDIQPGKHSFTVSIPDAQEMKGDELNHWLVSAYLIWEE